MSHLDFFFNLRYTCVWCMLIYRVGEWMKLNFSCFDSETRSWLRDSDQFGWQQMQARLSQHSFFSFQYFSSITLRNRTFLSRQILPNPKPAIRCPLHEMVFERFWLIYFTNLKKMFLNIKQKCPWSEHQRFLLLSPPHLHRHPTRRLHAASFSHSDTLWPHSHTVAPSFPPPSAC